jgi:hypothetical protein
MLNWNHKKYILKKSSIFETQSNTDLRSNSGLTESLTRLGSGVQISTNSSVLLQALIEINDKNSNISISRKSFVREFLLLIMNNE